MENFFAQLNSEDGKKLFTAVVNKITTIATDSSLTNEQKFETVVDYCYGLLEQLDDNVQNIPVIGWLIKLLVDNPIADSLEREACRLFVQLVYRSVKPLL